MEVSCFELEEAMDVNESFGFYVLILKRQRFSENQTKNQKV